MQAESGSLKRVLAVCPHDCPDTCSMVAWVRDGRLERVEGNPDHPFTRGHLCRKVAHYEERVYSADRVLHPMRRIGPKGEGRFEQISWDEAMEEIVTRWKAIIAEHGAESILPYSYAGTMGVVNMHACEGRLWNRMGASQLERTICSSSGEAGHTYTMGWSGGMDPEAFALSRFIIAWGTNLSSTNVHQMAVVREAQRQGANFVVIDPYRTRTAQCADWYIQIRPGADSALALSMMHVIFSEGLHDAEYLARYTVGWRELRERAAEYPPEETARITGVPAGEIVQLARMYAEQQPSAIRLGYGLTRTGNGGMMARTITCLPAVIGAWDKLGGGLLLSTSAHFHWNRAAVKRPDLLRGSPRSINMNQLGRALTELNTPPVMSLFVWNSNPAAVAPNSNLVRRGLEREDLFTVVHEQMLTDTARYADIVLPATTQMEHLDLNLAYGHLYVQLNQPAIAPLGESRPNIDVQHELAHRMGFTDPCFNESAEDIIRLALATDDPRHAVITYEYLKEHGFAKLRPDLWSGFAESEPASRPATPKGEPLGQHGLADCQAISLVGDSTGIRGHSQSSSSAPLGVGEQAATGPPNPPITGGTNGRSGAQRETVIASEAKQSPMDSASTNGDCFVVPPRNDSSPSTCSPRYRGAGGASQTPILMPFTGGRGFITPSGKIELYSERAKEDGFDPLPRYEPADESAESDPRHAARYPINLLTPAAHHFLNSSFGNVPSLMKAEKEPRVWVNPADAQERGIAEGDPVRVWNERGEVLLRAVVSDSVESGVAWSPSLWWHRDSPAGCNVNALTSDSLTDMGGGSTFHTNLVQIAAASPAG